MGEGHLGILLTVKAIGNSLTPTRLETLLRMHFGAARVKAACISVLGEARESGAEPPLVAAAVQVSWKRKSDGPASKQARTEVSQVRCRHILLRHVGSQTVGERKEKPKRTKAEAETRMLEIFEEITHGAPTAFSAKCREVSECDTALRGGDLSGDLGWLDRNIAKKGSKK